MKAKKVTIYFYCELVFYFKKTSKVIPSLKITHSEQLMADENTLSFETCLNFCYQHNSPSPFRRTHVRVIRVSKTTGVPHDDASVFVIPLIP